MILHQFMFEIFTTILLVILIMVIVPIIFLVAILINTRRVLEGKGRIPISEAIKNSFNDLIERPANNSGSSNKNSNIGSRTNSSKPDAEDAEFRDV